jgi:hypothetical protein
MSPKLRITSFWDFNYIEISNNRKFDDKNRANESKRSFIEINKNKFTIRHIKNNWLESLR